MRVRAQDGDAAIPYHPCEQMTDLQIGVSVVAVIDVRAFAEQCVGFVEE